MNSGWIKAVLAIVLFWWAYLFFTTEMVIVYDAEGYEQSGRIIADHGLSGYLKQGPQREPLFPEAVALSMRLGDAWHISYHYPLKIVGFFFLFSTLVFSYRLMNMLSVRPWLIAVSLLYLGISPALTNSTLRLWSEFAAYPWVVLTVIWSIKSWKALKERRDILNIMAHAAMLGLMFLMIMFAKAVAEGVVLFYLWPFYVFIFSQWRTGNFLKANHAAVFCLIVLVVFEGGVNLYKWENYRFNGHYAFTTRGDWALYGNTARRMEPLTPSRLGAAIAFVPGIDICARVALPQDCAFWSYRTSDDIIDQKRQELQKQGIKGEAVSKYFIFNSAKMVLTHPVQEMVLMLIEAHKMFFWEGPTAFVAYPDWLEQFNIKSYTLLKIIVGFLSWGACIFAAGFLWRRRPADEESHQVLFWTLNFIFWYMGAYSLFFILDRYALPLAALFMVLITFMLDRFVRFIR